MQTIEQQVDFEALESRFCLTDHDPDGLLLSVRGTELAENNQMSELLAGFGSRIPTQEPDVAASYMAGWLRYAAYGFLYSISAWNIALDLSLSNLSVQLYENKGYGQFAFKLSAVRGEAAPADEAQRAVWRERVLQRFYSETVRPILEAMAREAAAPIAQLWGQMVTGCYYYLNGSLEETSDPVQQERIRSDYRFLTEQMSGEAFGRKANPYHIKLRMVEGVKDPQKQLPLKATCCLYYRTSGGIYCYTCPKLTDEQRAERLAQLRSGS